MSLQSHFEVTWLEKTRVEVTSKFRSYAKKLFEKTVPVTPNSEALSSARPRTEDGYPRVHTSNIQKYAHMIQMTKGIDMDMLCQNAPASETPVTGRVDCPTRALHVVDLRQHADERIQQVL